MTNCTSLANEYCPPSGEYGLAASIHIAPTQIHLGTVPLNALAYRHDDTLQLPLLPTIPGYELLNQIGAGGMGVVYQARHIELDRIVALKVLTRESMLDRESHERFHREATAVAKVQNPNIIQVFDVGTYPVRGGSVVRQPYLSLEFVGGGSLVQLTHNPQPLKHVAKLVETIARAVHAAHLQGVIHRDLKPGNVLLTHDGTPKIADFGLAKSMDSIQSSEGEALTQVGILVGTPEYMSPEQVLGQDDRPCVDIYAIGVILYELLTARVPFKGETPIETLVLLQSQEPLSPKKLKPNLPVDLETICLKCLQKNPAKRYATAEDIADELARWQRGESIQARPVSVPERVYSWTKRKPAIASLIGLVLLGTVGTFLALLIAYGIAENKTKLALVAEAKAAGRLHAERQELYRASCLAASSALQLFNTTMAKQALDDAPVDNRGWEWNYFRTQLDISESVLNLQETADLVRRPSGSDFWIFSDGNTRIIVMNLRTRQIVRRESHTPAKSLLSRDFGRTLYSLRMERGPVEIRKIETGEVTARIDCGQGEISIMSVSEDDQNLLVETPTELQFWDLSLGKLRYRFTYEGATVNSHNSTKDHSAVLISIVKDGKRVLNGVVHSKLKKFVKLAELQNGLGNSQLNGDGTRLLTSCMHPNVNPTLWDTATGLAVAKLKGPLNQIKSVLFSADSKTLVTGSMDHSIWVWDGETGVLRHNMSSHRGWINDLAFSPDGTQIAACCADQTISLWNLQTGKEQARLLGHDTSVQNIAYTPQGDYLLSVTQNGTVLNWNIPEIEKKNGLNGHTDFVYSVDYHPTEPWAITSSWDGSVRIWDVNTCKTISTFMIEHKLILNHVRFHPNGRWFMVSSRVPIKREGDLRLCDVKTGEVLRSWRIQNDIWRDGRGEFSPDRKSYVLGGIRAQVVDLDDPSGKARSLTEDMQAADVVHTPDGKFLVVANENPNDSNCLVLIERATGNQHTLRIPEILNQGFSRLAIHPKSNLLYAATVRGKIFVIDIDKETLLGEFENGVQVFDLVFTPDGTRLAVACSNKLIRIWDANSLKLITELTGHSNYVHALAFSPDGSTLVSGSGDKTVRIWKAIPPTPNP